ncbi:MAG: SpoIIE family protein phosphatase [Spirochaetales bacterium]|nr:SpoIIE family protein phosphatase [Spirochaetales bacterium]
MKSLGVKLGILYIFLSIINVSFFTILIHENQIDLITKVKKYETIELATDITSEINLTIQEINLNSQESKNKAVIEYKIIDKCNSILTKSNYILFTIEGEVIYEFAHDAFPFNKSYLWEAQNAITRKEFSNKPYTASFFSDKEIHFYVPLAIENMSTIILLFQLDISDIHDKLETVYRMIFIFILFIILFHILFGIILHRIVVFPINILAKKSGEISKGLYQTRVDLNRVDEFGTLTDAFNQMAQSIQDKIEYLDTMNERMKLELQMAGEVQKSIYPQLRKTKYFDIAIYHKPLREVSGDYHDIFTLGNDKFGCFIADVSGHGVSAALITMLIKEKCEEIADIHMDTKDFFQHLNTFFGNLIQKYDKFFTSFYTIIDGKNQTLTFTNAGQSFAFLLRGTEIVNLNTNGTMIGVSQQLNHLFESGNLPLNRDDKIIIFSDGINEMFNANRKQYGIKRLKEVILSNALLSCNELIDSILADLSTFKGDAEQKDDETLIIIEMKNPDMSDSP